ncbi:hypothetical protein [Xanthomonas sp. 4461]|uniref:hypothetical protein n=1 Tax=Xanthomonas sp. 4461 TaxID=3035313 RepID=UPI0021676548|nr:hypothetical protein [Xanthomonas sp. 4461]MCS3809792.1 hypothetical protein [Xanthomonas sp. 4461]
MKPLPACSPLDRALCPCLFARLAAFLADAASAITSLPVIASVADIGDVGLGLDRLLADGDVDSPQFNASQN